MGNGTLAEQAMGRLRLCSLSLSRNTGIAGISHVLNLFIIGLFCMRRTGLFAIVNPNNLIT